MYNTGKAVSEKRVQNPIQGSIDHRGVDPEGVDLPVSICECLGVLVDDWQGASVSILPDAGTKA